MATLPDPERGPTTDGPPRGPPRSPMSPAKRSALTSPVSMLRAVVPLALGAVLLLSVASRRGRATGRHGRGEPRRASGRRARHVHRHGQRPGCRRHHRADRVGLRRRWRPGRAGRVGHQHLRDRWAEASRNPRDRRRGRADRGPDRRGRERRPHRGGHRHQPPRAPQRTAGHVLEAGQRPRRARAEHGVGHGLRRRVRRRAAPDLQPARRVPGVRASERRARRPGHRAGASSRWSRPPAPRRP